MTYGKSKDLAKITQSDKVLTLFRMGFLGAAQGWGRPKGTPSLKSVTHILE